MVATCRTEVKKIKAARKRALEGKDIDPDDESVDPSDGEGCKTEIKFQFYRSDPALGVVRTYDIPVILRV